MRFKEGSKVEVLSKKDVPSGSWRCAEITCGNGHSYSVRYVGNPSTIRETVVERVSRKAIRPCPPLSEIAENWVLGDVVELFDDFSWKMATITKVLCKEYFLVRILGSSLEFKVRKSDIRTRQSWEDGKWIVIGKGSSSCEDRKHEEKSTLKCKQNSRNIVQITKTRLNEHVKNDFFPSKKNEILPEFNIISCKNLKRGPYFYKQVEEAEVYEAGARKHRAVEKEGRLHRVIVENQSLLPEQVHDIVFPKETKGEKFIYSSCNNQIQFSDMDMVRRAQTGAVGYSSAIELNSDDEVSVTSSVGSCSTTRNDHHVLQHLSGFVKDIDGFYSDAESFCHRGNEEGNILLPKEELDAEIHRLELHAYRCTMEALYASGPLSWDQEALVTNLRLSLHISNDEHLMEGQGRGIYTSLPNLERSPVTLTSLVLLNDVGHECSSCHRITSYVDAWKVHSRTGLILGFNTDEETIYIGDEERMVLWNCPNIASENAGQLPMNRKLLRYNFRITREFLGPAHFSVAAGLNAHLISYGQLEIPNELQFYVC